MSIPIVGSDMKFPGQVDGILLPVGYIQGRNNLTFKSIDFPRRGEGSNQDFSKGVRVTLCHTEGTHQIFMSPPSCVLLNVTKKAYKEGS